MMNIVQEHTLNAELWIDDIFIRQGLKNILADIVFEDDSLIVVNKPSGMVVHPSKGHYSESL